MAALKMNMTFCNFFVCLTGCPDPDTHAHTSYTGTNFQVGDTVTYVCDSGTHHVSGDLVWTCETFEPSVIWNGTIPVCGKHISL